MAKEVKISEKPSIQARLIAYVSLIVTVGFWSQGTDPFNLPKLVVLVIGATALLGSAAPSIPKIKVPSSIRFEIIAIAIFVFALLNSFFFSGAPKLQMFFGTYARNTGMLNYLALVTMFYFAMQLQSRVDFEKVLKYFLISFGLVAVVSMLEVSGVNIQRVNLTFKGSLIGTFGNPNFISAYLGMCGTVLFTLILGWKSSLPKRSLLLIPFVVSALLILRSNSRQGLVVLLGGCAFIGLFYLILQVKRKALWIPYLATATVVSMISIVGVFNKGPLAEIIYKSSIGFRGEYWKAGIAMFKEKPLTGVGLNSYGDWYRTLRSDSALVSPGPEVFTNTAHNVYIDYAAMGGFPLILAFLFIVLLTVRSATQFIKRRREFDPLFFAFLGAWVVYSVQALISIDQIGLAIWGWILGGLIIAYNKVDLKNTDTSQGKNQIVGKKIKDTELIPASMLLSIIAGMLLGLGLIFPLYKSDLDVRKAYDSTSAELLIEAAGQWPTNTYKSANIAGLLINNNLKPQSLDVARKGLEDNPRSFDLWKLIYLNDSAPLAERKTALAKMKELDPKNPSVIAGVVRE
jgi:O-antigen ligase